MKSNPDGTVQVIMEPVFKPLVLLIIATLNLLPAKLVQGFSKCNLEGRSPAQFTKCNFNELFGLINVGKCHPGYEKAKEALFLRNGDKCAEDGVSGLNCYAACFFNATGIFEEQPVKVKKAKLKDGTRKPRIKKEKVKGQGKKKGRGFFNEADSEDDLEDDSDDFEDNDILRSKRSLLEEEDDYVEETVFSPPRSLKIPYSKPQNQGQRVDRNENNGMNQEEYQNRRYDDQQYIQHSSKSYSEFSEGGYNERRRYKNYDDNRGFSNGQNFNQEQSRFNDDDRYNRNGQRFEKIGRGYENRLLDGDNQPMDPYLNPDLQNFDNQYFPANQQSQFFDNRTLGVQKGRGFIKPKAPVTPKAPKNPDLKVPIKTPPGNNNNNNNVNGRGVQNEPNNNGGQNRPNVNNNNNNNGRDGQNKQDLGNNINNSNGHGAQNKPSNNYVDNNGRDGQNKPNVNNNNNNTPIKNPPKVGTTSKPEVEHKATINGPDNSLKPEGRNFFSGDGTNASQGQIHSSGDSLKPANNIDKEPVPEGRGFFGETASVKPNPGPGDKRDKPDQKRKDNQGPNPSETKSTKKPKDDDKSDSDSDEDDGSTTVKPRPNKPRKTRINREKLNFWLKTLFPDKDGNKSVKLIKAGFIKCHKENSVGLIPKDFHSEDCEPMHKFLDCVVEILMC